MRYFKTVIGLPVGAPADSQVLGFLRRVFEEYRWFRPTRYGSASLDKKLDPDHIDYDSLMEFYAARRTLMVAARTDRDFFMLDPAAPGVPPYTGSIIWETSAHEAKKPSWRATHRQQISELMQWADSPLAQAGLDEDFQRKTQRLIPHADGIGEQQVYTVRDYSEGLEGIYWRNFLGPPFVRLFGERLHSLPAGYVKEELGGGIVLVQPYEEPALAGTEEGVARERALIAHLGPECFYDHERHLKPIRLPQLPPAP